MIKKIKQIILLINIITCANLHGMDQLYGLDLEEEREQENIKLFIDQNNNLQLTHTANLLKNCIEIVKSQNSKFAVAITSTQHESIFTTGVYLINLSPDPEENSISRVKFIGSTTGQYEPKSCKILRNGQNIMFKADGIINSFFINNI